MLKVFLDRGADAKRDERKCFVPGGISVGLKCGFELSMKTLHDSVAFRMVSRGAYMLTAAGEQQGVERTREMRAAVGGDGDGETKLGDPAFEESACCGFRRAVTDWDGVRPSGKTIDTRQDVDVAVRWGQRANQIHVHVFEACVGRRKRANGRSGVPVYLTALAVQARLSPLRNVAPHVVPNETLGDVLDGGSYSWMGQIM